MNIINKRAIKAKCPLCNKTITFDIDRDLIEKTNKIILPFVIEHCDSVLITYLDKHFDVRGIEPVHNILDINKLKQLHNEEITQSVNSEFIAQLSEDERTIFVCKLGCDSINMDKIPNFLEKQLLKIISKYNEISLAILIKKVTGFEKALNRIIDREIILKILEKYIHRGIIAKQYLKFDEEFSSIKNSNLIEGGNI